VEDGSDEVAHGPGGAGGGWSLDRISGRYRLEGVDMAGRQRIYVYIREDPRNGGTLWKRLRRGGNGTGRDLIPGPVFLIRANPSFGKRGRRCDSEWNRCGIRPPSVFMHHRLEFDKQCRLGIPAP